MQIYGKLRQLRKANHLSQEELALKLNMSPNGYAKIERGETRLNIPRLEQIAEVFDMDIFELMQIDEQKLVYQVNKNDNNNNNVAFNGISQDITTEIDKLKLIIGHKDELLVQKQREIEHLNKVIALLEAENHSETDA